MRNIDDDALQQAARLEQLGDEAAAQGMPAATYYLESQRLLLPAGIVWTDHEAYATHREAFDRLQEKLYSLDGSGRPRIAPAPAREAPIVEAPIVEAPVPPITAAELSVWNLQPGMHLQVMQTFQDYDGQEIQAGEILHFQSSTYFFYDGGHTLHFAEKTIRLADVVEEHHAIIANAHNAWFAPMT